MADATLELGLAAQHEAAEALVDHLYNKNDDRGIFLVEVLLNVQCHLLKSTCEAFIKRTR